MNTLQLCALAGLCSLSVVSCGPTDQEVRTMIGEALREHAGIQHISRGTTIGPYSPAVSAGGFIFLSGQIGMDPGTGKLAGTDISSQTRQALENISSILGEAGLDSSAVIQCTVFLTDIDDYRDMNMLYGGYFGEGRYPARTTVEVSDLPAGALIEISVIAYKGQE